MENASKALLMAAGVLIGLLVLSLMVYLFVSFGSNSKVLHEQIEMDRVGQFNSQFTSYQAKEGVTIYDIVTVASLATENNKYYGLDKKAIAAGNQNYADYYVAVFLQGKGQVEYGKGTSSSDMQTAYNNLIEDTLTNMNHTSDTDQSELIEYNCETYTSNVTGRVYYVKFTQK